MAIRNDYQRNRRRIQSYIRRLQNQGYILPDNLLPDIPKRITPASVRRLEKITAEKIFSKARGVDVSTGEIISPETVRKERQLESAERRRTRRSQGGASRSNVIPDYSDIIIRNFEREMTLVFGRNERLFNYIQRWFQKALDTYGKEDLSQALDESYQAGDWPGWEAVSDEELLVGSLSRILDLVGGSQGARDEIIEELEYGEEWTDY